jgi:hypothetical protein
MRSQFSSNAARLSGAVALVAATMALPVKAANLLLNPGFESPTDTSTNVDSTATGWNFILDCQRATFYNNTPAGEWSVWLKTYEAAGGGIFQDVPVVAGSNYNLTAQFLFESAFPSIPGGTVDLQLMWLDSGGNPIGTPAINTIQASSVTTTGSFIPETVSGIAPAGSAQVQVEFDWSNGSTVIGQQSAFVDDADLEGAGTPPSQFQWAATGSGNWNLNGNWSSGNIPNGVGVEADLTNAITAPSTVYTDIPITLGKLDINNANQYVVTGAGTLTLQGATGTAALLQVDAGTQKIDLPLTLASNTTFNVASGANLLIANPLTVNSGVTLTQSGAGKVTYQSTVTVNAINLTAGATAAFSANRQSSAQVSALSIATGAAIDLANNSLTVNFAGGSDPISTIKTYLKNGYNGGTWNGTGGINSSSAAANSAYALGYLDATDPGGSAGNVKIKYTLIGDTNLDGTVNLTDLLNLLNSYGQAGRDWAQGDQNYDGSVNLTDLLDLLNNYGQTAAATVAVPEPATASLLAVGAVGMLARRRRRA